ncbi:MAG: thiamine pyrophosphate-binding protein, partial [Lachnospiraceae bacterium]|nr:thiamine pyrophosphate-binding protein [Candidatus Minthocola equi]
KLLVSDAVLDYLERRGVEYIFGLCGHTLIGLLDAMSDSKKIKYISVRHEQIATHAADGYARITHKAGVVMCHVGPGLTNTITGVANAALDSIPMVVICGDVHSYYFGRHPHQEVNMHQDGDQCQIYRPIAKRVYRIDDPEALPYILDKAFRLAESGRPGPVIIDVPMDMFSRETEEWLWARTYQDSPETVRPGLDPATAEKIAKKLIAAKRPCIYAGGGVLMSQASEELKALADFLDLPVARTLMGQGCIPDSDPHMIGQTGFWGLGFTHTITAKADVLLALGTRFGEADSSSWYPGVSFDPSVTKFIQIDIDPAEIGRNYPVEIGAIADIKFALQAILAAAKKLKPEGIQRPTLMKKIAKAKAEFKKSNVAISNDGRYPMSPQRILKDVKEALPEDAYIFTDVGWNKNGVAQQYDINIPGTIHHTSGLCTMGFGAAAVLGGALAAAKQKRIAITLTGDGGFGAANPCVLATAVEQGIGAIWVIMDNYKFGTINGLQNGNYDRNFGTAFKTPDGKAYNPAWEDVAKAYGVEAVRILAADEFLPAMKAAVKAAKAGKPYVIEVPMENLPVPTPGCWNINDIYTGRKGIAEGKVRPDKDGNFIAPDHSKTHKNK